jgi:hypothetical protein
MAFQEGIGRTYIFLCQITDGQAVCVDVILLHDDFRGNTAVVHLTAIPIKNYQALQKGDTWLLIHALYYESRINMACRSFFC